MQRLWGWISPPQTSRGVARHWAGVKTSLTVTFRETPFNCRFECDDANHDLSHYKECFDVVHMRMVSVGIEDALAFFHRLPDLLRPGGILLVIDGNSIHGENRTWLVQDDVNAPVRVVFRSFTGSL